MSKEIIRRELAHQVVLDYEPPKFHSGTPVEAMKYLEIKKENPGHGFKMADSIRVQTGVAEHEEEAIELRITDEVLARLKETQESAYREAYQLGLSEGKSEAFQSFSQQITEKLENLENLIANIAKLKMELVSSHEASLIKLLVHMASKIAMQEVQVDTGVLFNVIKQATELSQDDEKVNISVSEVELNFLEELKKQKKKEFEFLKQVQIQGTPDVSPGGCIIETNYGVVDAQIEERINKLWTTVSELVPKSKDRVSAA